MFLLLLLYCLVLLIQIDLNLILMKLQSILLRKSLHFLFSRFGFGVFCIIFLSNFFFFDPETVGRMMAPSGASGSGSGEGGNGSGSWGGGCLNQENASANPRGLEGQAGALAASNPAAEEPLDVPSDASSSKGTWFRRCISCCLNPKTAEEGGHSVSPPEPTRNWVMALDLPGEEPSDTICTLRSKCALLIESFSENNKRDSETFEAIANHLVLERKGSPPEIEPAREDFERLLAELQNPSESDVYLRVLKALETHP
jgi:hypothetical protein